MPRSYDIHTLPGTDETTAPCDNCEENVVVSEGADRCPQCGLLFVEPRSVLREVAASITERDAVGNPTDFSSAA